MNEKKQKGYAILFTVVLVSVISLIAVGLSDAIYKQLLLSSGARDSQVAFFQSDMATECALYADIEDEGDILNNAPGFLCGLDNHGNVYSLTKDKRNNSNGSVSYFFTRELISPLKDTDPCFEIEIIKTNNGVDTEILARGYNICNKSGLRAVERTIQIKY